MSKLSPRPRGTPTDPGGGPDDSAPRQRNLLLERNLRCVLDRIENTEAKGDCAPELIAVTKTVPPDVALALCDAMSAQGLPVHLAENRADRFEEKALAFEAAGRQPRWHFIGHIQRNKARRILERADVLHSIDSVRLASTVVRLAAELDHPIEVFIEVNLTGETEKHGLLPADVPNALALLAASSHVQVSGLMAMGPARELHTVDEVFSGVAALARDLQERFPDAFQNGACRLSMGMSGDLESAIRHGSSYVRIGSALFKDVSAATSPSPRTCQR